MPSPICHNCVNIYALPTAIIGYICEYFSWKFLFWTGYQVQNSLRRWDSGIGTCEGGCQHHAGIYSLWRSPSIRDISATCIVSGFSFVLCLSGYQAETLIKQLDRFGSCRGGQWHAIVNDSRTRQLLCKAMYTFTIFDRMSFKYNTSFKGTIPKGRSCIRSIHPVPISDGVLLPLEVGCRTIWRFLKSVTTRS